MTITSKKWECQLSKIEARTFAKAPVNALCETFARHTHKAKFTLAEVVAFAEARGIKVARVRVNV